MAESQLVSELQEFSFLKPLEAQSLTRGSEPQRVCPFTNGWLGGNSESSVKQAGSSSDDRARQIERERIAEEQRIKLQIALHQADALAHLEGRAGEPFSFSH
jgi:hypothetical protein